MTYSEEDRVGDQIERVSGVRFAGGVIRAALERDPGFGAFLGGAVSTGLLDTGHGTDQPSEPLIERARRLRDALAAQGYPELAYIMPLTGSPNGEEGPA